MNTAISILNIVSASSVLVGLVWGAIVLKIRNNHLKLYKSTINVINDVMGVTDTKTSTELKKAISNVYDETQASWGYIELAKQETESQIIQQSLPKFTGSFICVILAAVVGVVQAVMLIAVA